MSLETQLAAVVARIRTQFNTVKGQIDASIFFAIGTSTADTDDTETDLTWTQVGGRVDSGYTHSEGSASIRLDSPGWYKIEYAAGLNISTNANRGDGRYFERRLYRKRYLAIYKTNIKPTFINNL